MRRFTFWLYSSVAVFAVLAAGFLAVMKVSPWIAVFCAAVALFIAWLAAERRPRP